DGAGATGAVGVAARGAAALGCAGITGSDAAPLATGALGADCGAGVEYCRCMPKLRADPRRFASATPLNASAVAVTTVAASTNKDFIITPNTRGRYAKRRRRRSDCESRPGRIPLRSSTLSVRPGRDEPESTRQDSGNLLRRWRCACPATAAR